MKKQLFIVAFVLATFITTSQAQVVSTFAGSGLAGSINGTGISASFYGPQGVCADASGNIYIADYGNNRIRKITPTGVVSTLAGTGAFGSTDGLGSAASFNYPLGVCADASGNIYVADTDNHKIRKITPTGVVSTFAGSSGPAGSIDGIGTAAKFNKPKGICVDGSGNIYVADSENNKIRKITPTGLVSTFAGTGGVGTVNGIAIGATFYRPNGICVDASNNIYVVDGGNQKIRKITTAGIVSTFAGTGAIGSTDGIGTVAKFNNPTGICVDAFDNIYVADNYNQKIRKITPTGIVSTFAGTGAIGSTNAIGTAASFNYPAGVCTDASSNIYITDYQNNIIRKITLTIPVASYSIPTGTICVGSPISFINESTGPTTSWSWSFPGATVSTYTNQNPIATYTNAGTYSITLVATNSLGSSLPFTQTITVNATPAPIVTVNSGSVCSGQSFTLVVGGASTYTYSGGSALVSPTVTTTYSVVGTSTLGCISSNIAVSTVTVTAPTVSVLTTNSLLYTGRTATLLAVSGATNYVWNTGGTTPSIVVSPTITTTYSVTVTDNIGCSKLASIKQNVISDLNQAQLVSTFAGSGDADAIDSVGILASFNSPAGVCTDGFGNIFVADSYNNKIRKITPTGIVSTFAGSGAIGAIDGIGTAASFNKPKDICSDAADNIYVADYFNNKIRKITPTGVVTTLAGSGISGSTNGTGTAASFNLPEGVCTDAIGNIYVGDTQNGKIRKITPTGIVSTFAGSGAAGSIDGIGTAASFSQPRGVCADALGNIYVADGANFKIRKISSTGVVSTFAGSGASGSAEGVGSSASFYIPTDVCSDAFGNIYVADSYNQKIRKITPTGVVSTFAGSGAFGSIDGTATGASFNFPTNLNTDASGNIYVAGGDNKIRKIVSVLIADFSISGGPNCVGSPISFMDVSSGAPTSWSWSFPGATVPTFTIQSPVVSYSAAGTYSVSLIVTNSLGSSTPYTQTISVLNPVPLLTVNSGSICAGQSFTIIASGASTYSYSSGSSIVSPTVSTTYSVVGTSTLGCAGTNTVISNVVVNTLPVIAVNSGSICSGKSFTMNPSGASTYTYSSGSNIVSPLATVNYSVTGTNALGCVGSNTAISTVVVNASPVIAVNNGSICAGKSFTMIPSGASTYSYSSGSSIVSPTVNTTYSVVGTSSLGCVGTNTAISNVLVNSTPSITVLGTNSVCIGTSNSYTATGAATYTWITGAITPSVAVSPTVSTSYSVIGVDVLGCSNTATINLIVNNTCADVWPGDANSDGVVDNLDVLELGLHYSQTGPSRAVTSNLWQSYFSNNWLGTITSGKNVNHSDCNGDGIIDVNDTLAIYNNYGLTHAFRPELTTLTNPQLSIVSDQSFVEKGKWGSASIYLGDVTAPITAINGAAFTLNFDNALIETDSIYLTYLPSFIDAGDNLRFRKRDFVNNKLLTATTHTNSTNVSGNGKIAVLHYKIKSTLTTDSPLNLSITQGNFSNASGSIVPLTTGTSSVLAVGASVGITSFDNSAKIIIYPNPAKDVLYFETTALKDNMSIVVYNALGQIVLKESIHSTKSKLAINGLANGVYFIDVLTNETSISKTKFVKE